MSASSLTSPTLLLSLLPQENSSGQAMRFCMKRASRPEGKPSPGCSLRRGDHRHLLRARAARLTAAQRRQAIRGAVAALAAPQHRAHVAPLE